MLAFCSHKWQHLTVQLNIFLTFLPNEKWFRCTAAAWTAWTLMISQVILLPFVWLKHFTFGHCRAELELNYAKGLQKLAGKLLKVSKGMSSKSVASSNNVWKNVLKFVFWNTFQILLKSKSIYFFVWYVLEQCSLQFTTLNDMKK